MHIAPHLIAFADRPGKGCRLIGRAGSAIGSTVGSAVLNWDTLLGKSGHVGVGHGTGSLVTQPRRSAGRFFKFLRRKSTQPVDVRQDRRARAAITLPCTGPRPAKSRLR